MARTIRSEVFFNELAAAQVVARRSYAHTTQAERAALRGATVRREEKRAAVRNAPARGRVDSTFLAAMVGVFALAMLLAGFGVASHGFTNAKRAAASVNCDAPVQACEGARACARMLADC